LHPNTPIPLSNELNLTVFTQYETAFSHHSLYIYGINGVNVYPWRALPPRPFANLNMYIYVSTVEFYMINKPLSDYACSPKLILDSPLTNSTSLFSFVGSLFLHNGNTYNEAQQPLCPYIFRNSRLVGFELEGQVDSFLYVNLLQFNKTNLFKDNVTSIDSRIDELTIINSYNYKVDESLVHPLVFKHLSLLKICNMIASIEPELFINLKNLYNINLCLDSVGNFFHQVGIEWMAYIGLQGAKNVTLQLSTLDRNSSSFYGYPDRDFCIFAPFLNYTQFSQIWIYDDVPGCTLTFSWLQSLGWLPYPLCNSTHVDKETRIQTMLKQCELEAGNTNKVSYQIYSDFYQTKILNMLFIELVPFVLIPCFCLIGLLLNWKIIQTLKDNEKKELKEDFYKYMSANAKFNCLYCLIFIFYPMTSCNWNASIHFCSTIYTSQFVQYFKIVMMAYFGEVIKMCANISYLMMTLNRYLLVGKDHVPWLVTIAKLEFKWVIRKSFLFSALINIGHGWEYRATDFVIFADLYFTNVYEGNTYNPKINGYSYSNYPLANQGWAYFYFSIVYFVINFCFFFIFNTALEVKIVRRLHKELKEKRERLSKMNASKLSYSFTSQSPNISQTEDDDKKREEEDRKKERRIIIMVVINSVLNFFLRAPDLLFWMENIQIWQAVFPDYTINKIGQLVPGFLSFITDISYLAFILTLSTNFFIFYGFNRKFNEAVVLFSNVQPKASK
jgi:hypothetical protein